MTRYAPLWLQQGSYAASVDRRLMGFYNPVPLVRGCKVTVGTAMTVNIAAGQCMVPTANNTGSMLCSSDAVEQVTLPAAPGAGLNRYDLVVCQARGNDLDAGSNNDFIFTYVQGTAAASPAMPATPNNACLLASIYVPGGSSQVTLNNTADRRNLGYWRGARSGAWSTNTTPTALGMDSFTDGRGNDQPYQWGLNINAFTAPVAGLYLVHGIATFTATAGGQFGVLSLYLNGGPWYTGQPTFASVNGNVIGGIAQAPIPCVVGDQIKMMLQAGAVGLAGGTGGDRTCLHVTYLGP